MTRYAIMKRRKGVRRAYADGYYSYDLELVKSIAKELAQDPEYSMVNVVDADTNIIIASFKKAMQ